MATTRIISMHINKGKTVAQCLTDRTDYAKNPDKTAGGELVSAYECDPASVDAEFMLSKRQYRTITGREQKNDVIAYQVRQSFRPGEVTPELANRLGYELAMKLTKGRHAFIIATHIDKAHIHNHVIWNSTALDCTRKYRDFIGSARAVRRISDTLCVENGLSIVANPQHGNSSYNKWLGTNKKLSYQDRLRLAIDAVLAEKPVDFDAFIRALQAAGYEYKDGKQPGFRAVGQERFTRLRSLKDGYSEEEIRAVISGLKTHTPRRKPALTQAPPRVNLLVDIQAMLQAGKGAGYERWAKVFNLKQMAKTMNYLSENGLLEYSALEEKAGTVTARFNELSDQIKSAEKRLAEIAVLRTHIVNYSKTREVYVAYRKAGYSKKFLAEHESDILLHKAAKKAFDELGVKKLPTVKSLQTEYAEKLADKKKAYPSFVKAREEMKEVLTAKANYDRLLSMAQEERKRPHEQEK
jgi:hypothetical protein